MIFSKIQKKTHALGTEVEIIEKGSVKKLKIMIFS